MDYAAITFNYEEFREGLIWVVAAIGASFFIVLDTVNKSKEPGTVMRTRAWWGLWFANAVVAFIVIYAATLSKYLTLGFTGFIAAIVGYPMLLRSKLFSIRGEQPGTDKSFGIEIVLQQLEPLFLRSIDSSIRRKTAQLIATWCEVGDQKFDKLADQVKNCLQGNILDPAKLTAEMNFVDNLKQDAEVSPKHKDANARVLFDKVRGCAGLNEIRSILKNCKK